MDAHSLDRLDFARVRELLAGYASTGLGKSLVASIRPLTRVELVRRWLAQYDELDQLDALRGLPPFGGISDVREIIRNCAPPLHVAVEDVARVGDTLAGTHRITEYLRDLPEQFPELRRLAERIGDFQSIASRIHAVIDERGQVRDDASPKIRRIRREIEDARAQIGTLVEKLLHDPGIRRFLQYPNHTFHDDRCVFPVKTEYRGRLPGIVHRSSDSGATLYVEPAAAVELNNVITNLRGAEQEEINRLLWELTHEIYLNGKEILRTLDTLAVIDLVAAKVRFAREYKLRSPILVDEPRLRVREARHPLLLALRRAQRAAGEDAPEIVPIDYRLGEDFNMLVITGPNTGGKTVALKTVGLLTLMVQAGLPVPVAPGTTMGVFHDVHVDVGDEQSMQQSLSTFSAHLTRQLDMLRRSGARALVLIDELGAGTDPDEGAAIGKTILDELLRLESRAIVTTHLGALKGFALTRERVENACVEFDVQTLRPTYHLRIGETGRSNAIDIAQRLGMPKRLVLAARRNLSRKARVLQSALAGTSAAKREAEQARAAAENAQLELARVTTETAAAKERLDKEKQDFQVWLQRVVHLQPGDAVHVRGFNRDGKVVRMRLEQQRGEIDVGAFRIEVPLADILPPEAPAPPPRPALPLFRPPDEKRPPRKPEPRPRRERPPPARPEQHPEPRPRPPLPSFTDAEVEALAAGAQVYAKRFHRNGTVVRINPSKKMVLLSVGILEVEVPYSGVGPIVPHERKEPRPRSAAPPPPARASDAV